MYLVEEFWNISLRYIEHAQKGLDIVLLVPHVLEKSRQLQKKIAQDNFDEAKEPFKNLQLIFQSGDKQCLINFLNNMGKTAESVAALTEMIDKH